MISIILRLGGFRAIAPWKEYIVSQSADRSLNPLETREYIETIVASSCSRSIVKFKSLGNEGIYWNSLVALAWIRVDCLNPLETREYIETQEGYDLRRIISEFKSLGNEGIYWNQLDRE